MITMHDMDGFCPLSMDEVRVIAAHEHLPDIVALEKVTHFLAQEYGNAAIHQMLTDEFRRAFGKGDLDQATLIQRMLAIFDAVHPVAYDRRTGRRQQQDAKKH